MAVSSNNRTLPVGGRMPQQVPRTAPSGGGTYKPAPRVLNAPAPSTGLDPSDQSAYDVMVSLLSQWGLEALAPTVLGYLVDGYTQEQVSILLQDSEPYKQRFAGNTARRAAGLPALAPAEYLAVESSYRQIMESAGLPAGFYDSPDDFAGWIGGDVSPQEIQSRVGLAVDAAQRLDDGTRAAFQDWYGVGETEIAAFFLDRERALPLVEQIARGVQVGGAAARNDLSMTRDRATQLAGFLGEGQVDPAMSQVAAATAGGTRLGAIYGQGYSQTDAEDEIVLGSESAKRRRRDLAALEQGTFSGTSGVGEKSLASTAKNF